MTSSTSLQNSFAGGLKTEFTGLNFPENACTDMDNCVISLIGEIARREGVDFEENSSANNISSTNSAISYYMWHNAGGDGLTDVLAVQVGSTLYFFQSSLSSTSNPISNQLLSTTVNLTGFQASGNTATISNVECQYTDGNGYLFVFHPDCDPFYCTFSQGTITPTLITVQIRDFNGIYEPGVSFNLRPLTLTAEHQYNLINQGWSLGNPWTATSTTSITPFGQTVNMQIQSGLTITTGTKIQLVGLVNPGDTIDTLTAHVNSYSGTNLNITIESAYPLVGPGYSGNSWTITPLNLGNITTWFSDIGVYPSNADIWWEYKDDTNTFDPSTTIDSVTVGAAQAPQGHFILNAFSLQRSNISAVAGLTNVITTSRPNTGCWFQGRVFYTGVNASQPPTGDETFYTWSENIYFSQIITPGDINSFGYCYQQNDPTDETLNQLLPTDGGVITIPGCGGIIKLFILQNSLLVFAANGIWLIAGQGGLGFTANSYSINKIASVQALTAYSFIDVLGTPIFWNEEGIYMVTPDQNSSPYQFAGFKVEPLTVGTILSFYNSIPKDSKKYARGTYDPLSYIVQWTYRSTQESGIANRYQFDSILNLNTFNKAFYPYSVSSNNACYISGIQYIRYPNSLNTPNPTIKYLTTVSNTYLTFAEEKDSTTWFDWHSYDNVGVDYTSYFTTGYNLHGKGLLKWLNTYIYMYADNTVPYSYIVKGIWDYANTGNSGRYSASQYIENFGSGFNKVFRRHKIRGHGMSLQINVTSVSGQPFTFFGWTMMDDIDAGI